MFNIPKDPRLVPLAPRRHGRCRLRQPFAALGAQCPRRMRWQLALRRPRGPKSAVGAAGAAAGFLEQLGVFHSLEMWEDHGSTKIWSFFMPF